MKDFIKTTLLAGLVFGAVMGLFFSLNGLYFGIIGGIIAGLLFGVLLSLFLKYQKNNFQKNSSQTADGKPVIMEGSANHFKGAEAVGGWLCLTKDELIFKSHTMNIQNHELIIPLTQIAEVKGVLTLGLVPNGLQITNTAGNRERFVVNTRKTWVQKILEQKTHGELG